MLHLIPCDTGLRASKSPADESSTLLDTDFDDCQVGVDESDHEHALALQFYTTGVDLSSISNARLRFFIQERANNDGGYYIGNDSFLVRGALRDALLPTDYDDLIADALAGALKTVNQTELDPYYNGDFVEIDVTSLIPSLDADSITFYLLPVYETGHSGITFHLVDLLLSDRPTVARQCPYRATTPFEQRQTVETEGGVPQPFITSPTVRYDSDPAHLTAIRISPFHEAIPQFGSIDAVRIYVRQEIATLSSVVWRTQRNGNLYSHTADASDDHIQSLTSGTNANRWSDDLAASVESVSWIPGDSTLRFLALPHGTPSPGATWKIGGIFAAGVRPPVTTLSYYTLGLSVSVINADIPIGVTRTATITRFGGDPTQPLTIDLTSLDTDIATVPATVTILANETSATFGITGVDLGVVTIMASHPDAKDSEQVVTVIAEASSQVRRINGGRINNGLITAGYSRCI